MESGEVCEGRLLQLLSGAGTVRLIKDSISAPAKFLLHIGVKGLLERGEQVVLLTTRTTDKHYVNALKKLGLPQHVNLSCQLHLCHINLDVALLSPSPNVKGCLQQIVADVVAKMRGLPTERSVTLVVDCLPDMAMLTPADRDWYNFLHCCVNLGAYVERSCRVLCIAHVDINQDERWVKYLEHCSDVVLEASPMEGQAVGIEGEVRAKHRGPGHKGGVAGEKWPGAAQFDPQFQAFYKTSDVRIQWMTQLRNCDLLS